MNENKICLIVQQRNNADYWETRSYVQGLATPSGYEVGMITISDVTSVAQTYNQAMHSNDAKYKIYIHHKALPLYKNMLIEIIEIFKRNEQVGLLGTIGVKRLPTDASWQHVKNEKLYGRIVDHHRGYMQQHHYQEIMGDYEMVQAVPNIIMATQYDIGWREDLFDGEYFYDIAQSIEFQNKGYEVGVVRQTENWCLYDGDLMATDLAMEKSRNVFLDEYSKDIFPLVSILLPTYNRPEWFKIALESALKQTYRHIEVIIGDDSTNEDTKKLMTGYLEKYQNITYFYNGGPLGEGGAVNSFQIFQASKGEYINYLMDDDIFHQDKIRIMMQYYLDDEAITLVTSHRQLINQDGNFLNDNGDTIRIVAQTVILPGEMLGRYVLFNFSNRIGEPTTVLVKRDKLEGFYGIYLGRKYLCNIDMATWLSLLRRGKAVYISKSLSYFRMHSGQNQRNHNILLRGVIDIFCYNKASYESGYYIKTKEEYRSLVEKWIKIVYNLGLLQAQVKLQQGKDYQEGDFDHFLACVKEAESFLIDCSKQDKVCKRCACCDQENITFLPLSSYYINQVQLHGGYWNPDTAEMLNIDEYSCNTCGAADRERIYAMWMKKNFSKEKNFKMLDIAPAKAFTHFVLRNFPNVEYKTADLLMQGVDYQVDIMDMHQIADRSFDFFICSHVLEHVRDDIQAMRELKRILKDDGSGILVVPLDLSRQEIDEDPDVTDVAERWRRFGQDDHIRAYSKQGFLQRIQLAGLQAIEYGLGYFSEEDFRQNGLTLSATVYVVSKA